MRRFALPLALAALWLALPATLWPPPAHAQWTNDPWNGMAIVTNQPGPETWPQIIRLSSGYYLVTFGVAIPPNYTGAMKYQLLDQFGNTLLEPGGRFVIEASWPFTTNFAPIPDGQGGAIVIFSDFRDATADIYGQRFDPLGNPLWGPTGLPLVLWPGNTNTLLKDVEPGQTGGAFVGYGIVAGAANEDIYLQKIDNSGQMLWGPTGVPIRLGPTDSAEDRIVRDSSGGALDLWQEYSGSTSHLYGQHFDADGNPLWGADGIPILDLFGQQLEVGSLQEGATDGRGGGIWVYTTPGATNHLNVFRVNGRGQTLWLWISPYYCSHWFNDMKRHSAYNTVWISAYDNRPGAPGYYLYQFDVSGRALFGSGGLPCGGRSLVETADGMIVLWADQVGLSARRVNSRGRVLWETNVALSAMLNAFNYPVGASDGADGAVVAFEDRRNEATDPDISAQRVQRNGRLGNPTFPQSVAAVEPQSLQMLPGGRVQFMLPQAGQIRLELFDLLGRRVATLRDGFEPAGIQTIPLDNSHLPSGIYLMRLRTPAGARVIKVLVTH